MLTPDHAMALSDFLGRICTNFAQDMFKTDGMRPLGHMLAMPWALL